MRDQIEELLNPLGISMSDHDIFEDCMKDRDMLPDRYGIGRQPLGEKDQNTNFFRKKEDVPKENKIFYHAPSN